MNLDTLIVPNPAKELSPIRLDLTAIHAAEGRTMEIAVVTTGKAPELMAVFNQACFQLARYYSELRFLRTLAEQKLAQRRAVVIIDIVPEKIKEKGLSQNEATRNALVDLDPEYQQCETTVAQLEAAVIYVEGKLRAMENNLNAVKKILGETNNVYHRANPNLSTSGFDAPQPTIETQSGLKIGKGKY